MSFATDALGTAFLDPPLDSSRMFRSIMNAIAWPGLIKKIDTLSAPPEPLNAVTADCLLTLVDFETPVWLDHKARTDEISAYLRFHAGCPIVDAPERAAFAVIADPQSMPDLSAFSQGTAEYPDRSATVILQTDALSNDQGVTFRGPGIANEKAFSAAGICENIWADIERNHQGFPLGVDVVFSGPDCLAACPRSVSVATSECV